MLVIELRLNGLHNAAVLSQIINIHIEKKKNKQKQKLESNNNNNL